ncbi:MAG: Ppx/GppA phosphatase family protein [Planctomycetota bacterium]
MPASTNGTAASLANLPSRIAPADAAAGSLRLSAVDVGSNSIHMIVAQVDADGGVTTLWRMKEPVGLGRISFPSKRLSKEAIDRAVVTLGRFQRASILKQAEKIVVIATSAVREAENGGDLIERVRRELKLRIKVVNAPEEARLIYLGVRHAIAIDDPHLIVDIGGGSVEFMVGDEQDAPLLESRKLGAARLTGLFIKSDPISAGDLEAVETHIANEMAPLIEKIKALNPVGAIGTSGTLENIAAMTGGLFAEPASDHTLGTIDAKPLEKLAKKLIKSTAATRAEMRDLDDQRRDQILAGVLVIRHVFKTLGLKQMKLCGAALREGILVDYFERKRPDIEVRREVPDPRRRSVLDLCRRCDWHKSHSMHVAMLTLALFDELRNLHKLGAMERELIEYAALMHDIGWHIGRKGHHKHSQYLIEHGRLRNFTDDEINIMAAIARYHRKALPRKEHRPYGEMSKESRRVVDVGAALLRLADGLDRSHAGAVTGLTCDRRKNRVNCKLQTRADAELEIWGADRKRDLFERVFEKTIEFEA